MTREIHKLPGEHIPAEGEIITAYCGRTFTFGSDAHLMETVDSGNAIVCPVCEAAAILDETNCDQPARHGTSRD